jgi:hypothetical protein
VPCDESHLGSVGAQWPDMNFDRVRLLIGDDFFSHETTQ